MLPAHFYHQHIRKAVAAFGTIFNNFVIKRTDAQGAVVQTLKVPLSYAPKQKMLARVLSVPSLPDDRGKVSTTLPRLSFELTTIVYDPSKHLRTTQRVRATTNQGTINQVFVAAPYNIGFRLSLWAKNQTDALQIVEQILPFFTPDFNVTVTDVPGINLQQDLNIVLNTVNYDPEFEGDFSNSNLIMWEFDFTLKMNFYGYVSNASVIKKVIANIYAQMTEGEGTRYTGTVTDGETTGSIWGPIWAQHLFADNLFAGTGISVDDDTTPLDYRFMEEFEAIQE